jgi:CheY-like chemotaxis protein
MPASPVLILSADPDTQDLYVTALRFRRRAAFGVANAEEALALADAQPGAIVVDVRSEEDWDEIDRLRRAGYLRHVPLVVLTGWVVRDGRFRRRAALAGCAAFLAKPSPMSAVLSCPASRGGRPDRVKPDSSGSN